jgi:hypothetical protein
VANLRGQKSTWYLQLYRVVEFFFHVDIYLNCEYAITTFFLGVLEKGLG